MTSPFIARVGGIVSCDIAVPEHEREARFYARVLGTGERPLWRNDLMNNQGAPIIGLGKQSPEYGDLPLCWMPHIQVADVAASVKRGLELGGREILHGKDDDGNSLWAALFDPSGAAFGIMPVVPDEAMPKVEGDASTVGCIAWVDLTVPDAAAICEFYREVVGWTVEKVPMGGDGESYSDFNLIGGDGQPAAGICHARGVNAGQPAVWMHYLLVGDLEESVRLVEEEGGKVLKAHRGSDGKLSTAVIEDPVGVCISLAQA